MPTSRSSCRTTRSRAGVSLLELLIVITILSVLFGIGVGAFGKLDRPDERAARALQDAWRGARLFARTESAPASVVVDGRAGHVHALGLRNVGNWHFETPDGAGWPVAAAHPPGALDADGVIGWGLRLGDQAELSVSNPPGSFDSIHGFGLDVFVQPEAQGRPMTILERPGLWNVDLDEADHLRVTLQLQSKNGVERSRHETTTSLPSHRPSRLQVVFDGRRLYVAVDGARAAEDTVFAEPRRLVRNPRVALRSGEQATRFRGLLDELRVASVVRGAVEELPEEVLVEADEVLLHADAFGHLDPDWHRTPAAMSFLFGEPVQRTRIEVGLLGTVQTTRAEASESDRTRLLAARAPQAAKAGGARGLPEADTSADETADDAEEQP